MFFLKKSYSLLLLLLSIFVMAHAEQKIVNNTNFNLEIKIHYSSSDVMLPCHSNIITIASFKEAIIPKHSISKCELYSLTINTTQSASTTKGIYVSLDKVDKKNDFLLTITESETSLIATITQNNITRSL